MNARDAGARGADIFVRTKVVSGTRTEGEWCLTLADQHTERQRQVCARMVVNAAAPWVGDVIQTKIWLNGSEKVRLVRGSHIVTLRLCDHDKCYLFQGTDGRIVFAIPYETDFTLIGTTDIEHLNLAEKPECSQVEAQYLVDFVNGYFDRKISTADIVWTYAGVRSLYDDGVASASAVTRDYALSVDDTGGAPILNVFNGKITTYRCLAEDALARIAAYFPGIAGKWTAGVPLPGGNFAVDGVGRLRDELQHRHPFLPPRLALRLVRAYGTEAAQVLGKANDVTDLGRDFGASLHEVKVRWLMAKEYSRTAEDVVWRCSKLGLRMTPAQIVDLQAWMSECSRATAPMPVYGPSRSARAME